MSRQNLNPPKKGTVAAQLSFSLYSAAGRMVRLHKAFLDPLGLTFPQYLVMLELLNGSPRFVGELGAKLAMDTGTITPLLKRMELAGLVTRHRDPSDERRVLVDLTDAGHALRGPILSVSDNIKTACQMSEGELNSLRITLDALAHPLKPD